MEEKIIENSKEKLVTNQFCSTCDYKNTDEIVWTKKDPEPIDEKFAVDRDRFCLTDEKGKEYQEAKWSLEQMGKLAKEWEEEEKRRTEKLKENPKGFHLEGTGYTCAICHQSTPTNDNWYDKYGVKCLVCQKAIDVGEIPPELAQDKESWYSFFDIEYGFNIKSPTIRKWIRQGLLKPKTVSYYGNGVHFQLFLIADNKDFLPPKKLIEYRSVTEIRDGKEWSSSRPWYHFVDPKEHLKGYKIMDYLTVTYEKKEENKTCK